VAAVQRAGQLATELATLTEQLAARDRELADATTAATELVAKVETAEREARQAREETTQLRTERENLEQQLREQLEQARQATTEAKISAARRIGAAESARDIAERGLQAAQDRLTAAQSAAGLVLPNLIDLSRDRGDGVSGVVLPDAGIEVARESDGAVVLHHHNTRIRLGDPAQAPAQGRALAAAVLAVSATPPRP
jgi:seryl-tRNA synthetase